MKQKSMFLLLLGMMFVFVVSGCTSEDPFQLPSLGARVSDGFTGEGIVGASFTVNGETKQTDEMGQCEFRLPAGTYTVTGSADGYKTRQEELEISGDGLASGIILYPDVPIQGKVTFKDDIIPDNIVERSVMVDCLVDGEMVTKSAEIAEDFSFSIAYEGIPQTIYAQVVHYGEYEPDLYANITDSAKIEVHSGWGGFYLDVDNVEMVLEQSGYAAADPPANF